MSNLISRMLERITTELKVTFGKKTRDRNYLSKRMFRNDEEAKDAYQRSIKKLFNVDDWSNLPGISSEFKLYDASGKRKEKQVPSMGDFIKIVIPGPFPENWVKVIDIQQTENATSFTVSPDIDPTDKEKQDVEHFFIDEATSMFKVERKGSVIIGYEIGRNEGINNKGEKAGNRKVLNTIVAETGWAAFQEIQWQKLTAYLVHDLELNQ